MAKGVDGEGCADIMRALADGTRLGVLQELLKRPSHVNDLMKKLDVPQSLLSHHLKVLRDVGLVVATRDGKSVLYQISPEIAGAREPQCIDLKCCQVVFRPGLKSRKT